MTDKQAAIAALQKALDNYDRTEHGVRLAEDRDALWNAAKESPAQSAEPAAPAPHDERTDADLLSIAKEVAEKDDSETWAADCVDQWLHRDVCRMLVRLSREAEPAAPAGADEARIARWEHLTFSSEERKVQEGVSLMRSLLARAVKAEGVLRVIDEVIADRGVPERDCTLPLPQRVDNLIVELKNWRHSYGEAALLAEKAETEIRHLRAKLAESEAEVERLRGRDAEPFDWDAAPNVQEWIEENLPEREPRAGSKMVELHADEVVADRGEARRVAGWLNDIMAENASLRAEADRVALAVMRGDGGLEVWNRTMTENADLRAKLAAAEKERDAAIAAQNAIRSSPPAAPAGEAPAQGGVEDVWRTAEGRIAAVSDSYTQAALRAVVDLVLARGER